MDLSKFYGGATGIENMHSSSTSGSFTLPNKPTFCIVKITAAGGGSNTGLNHLGSSGGGAGGGAEVPLVLPASTVIHYELGAKGRGVSTSWDWASDGGDSLFYVEFPDGRRFFGAHCTGGTRGYRNVKGLGGSPTGLTLGVGFKGGDGGPTNYFNRDLGSPSSPLVYYSPEGLVGLAPPQLPGVNCAEGGYWTPGHNSASGGGGGPSIFHIGGKGGAFIPSGGPAKSGEDGLKGSGGGGCVGRYSSRGGHGGDGYIEIYY